MWHLADGPNVHMETERPGVNLQNWKPTPPRPYASQGSGCQVPAWGYYHVGVRGLEPSRWQEAIKMICGFPSGRRFFTYPFCVFVFLTNTRRRSLFWRLKNLRISTSPIRLRKTNYRWLFHFPHFSLFPNFSHPKQGSSLCFSFFSRLLIFFKKPCSWFVLCLNFNLVHSHLRQSQSHMTQVPRNPLCKPILGWKTGSWYVEYECWEYSCKKRNRDNARRRDTPRIWLSERFWSSLEVPLHFFTATLDLMHSKTHSLSLETEMTSEACPKTISVLLTAISLY